MVEVARALARHRKLVTRRRLLLAGVFAAIVEAALLVPVPWFVAHAIDRSLPARDTASLVWSAVGILAATIGSILVGLAARAALLTVTRAMTASLRRECTERLIHASRQFHTDADEGALHDALVTDSARVDQMVSVLLGDVVPGALTIAGLVVALVLVNGWLALVTALLAPLLIAAHRAFRTGRRRAVDRFHGAYERFAAGVLRVVRSDELIRVEGVHAVAQQEQDRNIVELERAGRWSLWLDAAHDGAQLAGVAIVASAILLAGGLLVVDGRLAIGELVSFYAAFGLLRRPVAMIAMATSVVNAGGAGLANIDAFLATVDREPYTGGRPVDAIGTLRLERVTFAYPGRPPILRDFSLSLARGETVGLAGPNGAGKSTVVHLLLGLYRPASGRASVDGVPYDEVDVVALRRRVGVVPQAPVFDPGSIRANLFVGQPDRPAGPDGHDRHDAGTRTGRLRWALATAGADAVVAALPDGLDTRIGDDAVRLSGGQRQRLAIARALLRDPDVLVLDEPTLHLDRASVSRMLATLRSERRAVLVVSHDPEVLAVATRVVDLGSRDRAASP